ncbi:uncharacterized protein LOC111047502 isoform X2 [Nilaparvata lugens]|uniref:uncharacterized protein LOC111047502 isoform X2 n=1 Tax=Nilaparvata lugens TaxID=108931 RepID=UPI00193D6793|nr:uncharacterized protein LOC111047502 isoform X2 [Nilaparvata lugens]
MKETVLFRAKRDAGPGRSMLFSGYFPDRGMTSYASSADLEQWNRAYNRRRPTYFLDDEEAWKTPQDNQGHTELTPPPQASGWSKPEQEETSSKDKDAADKPGADNGAKKPKRRRPATSYHHQQEEDAEEGLEEDGSAGSAQASTGGNAKASFNAWFPIVFGMFPPSREDRDDYDGYSSRRGQQQQQQLHRTTIMANSVSHGAGGVATSHAIYGLPPQLQRKQQR